MNATAFKYNLKCVVFSYLIAIIIGIMLKTLYLDKENPIYSTFKDLIPFFIAIPAAWLGYCFQRRQAYLKDVRDLWSRLVPVVQDSIQYTFLTSPEQLSYSTILKNLSIVIDEFRAVFMNIGEDDNYIGLYPFQEIKEIRDIIRLLGYGDSFNSENALDARRVIVAKWKNLRKETLSELERGVVN